MLGIYLTAAIIGVVLILVSLLGGHGDHGSDSDAGHETDHSETADGHHSSFVEWLPFLSLRFWTYFCGGFGLIGTLLTMLKMAGPTTTFNLSLGMGLGLGLLVWLTMKWATRSEVGRSVATDDLVGKTGRVLVACRPGQMGKVRIEVRGDWIDLMALDEGLGTLEIGEEVIVTRLENSVAHVVGLHSALEGPLTT
ncbi:MAG TPA: NfeD family protein [Fimbriimonadaceae bacterium]|nr:NfeD family protein [Fimbriimonadaceae bacterium]HRJ32354.1 NfeD family protein [Fimbriimonadaceae bacterium]